MSPIARVEGARASSGDRGPKKRQPLRVTRAMSRRRHRWSSTVLAALLGCGEVTAPALSDERERVPAVETPEGAAAPEPVEPDVNEPEALEPEPLELDPEPLEVAEAPAEGAAALMGRWVPSAGHLHCIELSEGGRFELTRRGSPYGAEVVVRGTFTVEGRALALRPSSIHAERWISRCREHVTAAGPLATFEVLGSTLRVGRSTVLRASREGPRLRLCGARGCEVLRRRDASGRRED